MEIPSAAATRSGGTEFTARRNLAVEPGHPLIEVTAGGRIRDRTTRSIDGASAGIRARIGAGKFMRVHVPILLPDDHQQLFLTRTL